MDEASIDSLQTDLAGVCGHVNALHASLVRLVADALDGRAWAQWGIHSPAHWLAWQAGLTATNAHKIVAVAEQRSAHPVTIAAFEAGELSLDQVALAVKAPGWADEQACGMARTMTVVQLSRVMRSYPFADAEADGARLDAETQPDANNTTTNGDTDGTGTDADTGAGEPAPAPESGPVPVGEPGCAGVVDSVLSLWLDDHGVGHLRGTFAADDYRVIEAALREARDALFLHGDHDGGWADALVEIADRSLDAVSPQRRDRFRVNLFVDVDASARFSDGWLVPDCIRRHITCDGTLSTVFREHSYPVGVGHSQHIVPDRTRRLVEHRDRGCRVPGCTQSRWVQVHHIIHHEHHGPTETWNLICLCPRHHRMHHQDRLGITGNADLPAGDPDAVTFTDHHGRTLAATGKPAPPTAPPPAPSGSYIHPLGERLDYRWVYFNPPRNPAA
ncbi:hypothetical protein BH20ACT4_BH20ACT4_03110 [soil metagenome]